MKTILITGGSGLVGSRLTESLLAAGKTVIHLSTNPAYRREGVRVFQWDPTVGEADTAAFAGVEGIVNLAGAPVNMRWTPANKEVIVKSRTDSAKTLYNFLQHNPGRVRAFVSASAVGYYPSHTDMLYTETDAPGSDFLSAVTQSWEAAVKDISALGIPTACLRIGIVLSAKGGALQQMKLPVKYGLGSPLGTGRQYMPWIHIDDLCGMLHFALENRLEGAFNATGPYAVTNAVFMETLARLMKKPYFLPAVPAFVLKLALGEMSQMALEGSRVSSGKIQQAGYRYIYPTLEEALRETLGAE